MEGTVMVESATSATSASSIRDDNAVNHEIAALLLNLASRTPNNNPPPNPPPNPVTTTSTVTQPPPQTIMTSIPLPDKPEDLTVVKTPEKAMDLSSKSKSSISMIPIKLPTLSTSNIEAKIKSSIPNPQQPGTGNSNYSSFFNHHNLATTMGLNSTYLLQNLLLGKMAQQQIANATNSPVLPSNFPTQPLPAQSLTSLPNKPPPTSVLKSTLNGSLPKTPLPIENTATGGNGNAAAGAAAAAGGNIPLLCGQIVAQLNGLLFLVHGLNNNSVELNLQNQLGAIYNRLQVIKDNNNSDNLNLHPLGKFLELISIGDMVIEA